MSLGTLYRVALNRTDVSEEHIVFIYRVMGLLNLPDCREDMPHDRSKSLITLKMEAIATSETSVLTRATRRHIPEDGILYSHRRENLTSCRANRSIGRSAPVKCSLVHVYSGTDVGTSQALKTCEHTQGSHRVKP
jgi:hypothetical protein